MIKQTIRIVVVALAALMAAGFPSPARSLAAAEERPAAPAADGQWEVAFTSDFSGETLDKKWVAVKGEATAREGAMRLKAGNGAAVAVLSEVFDAPSVRVEVVGSFVKSKKLSDFSILLNTTDRGSPDGYLLQYGGKGNMVNLIDREREMLAATETVKGLPMEAEKTYTLVAENDKGNITLKVNGETILDYKDPAPISGKKNGHIGLYTWNNELKVEKVTVWVKK